MKKKSIGIVISGVMLIMIFLSPFLKAFLITAIALYENAEFSWGQWLEFTALDLRINMYGTMGYFGLESIFNKMDYSLPLRCAHTMNYIAVFIKYLLVACSFTMLPLGIGVLVRREKFRVFSVIALSIMLSFGIINMLGRYISYSIVSPYNILSAILFGILLCYLIRPGIKEQFK